MGGLNYCVKIITLLIFVVEQTISSIFYIWVKM